MNMMNATTRGIEVSPRVQVLPSWQLTGGYSYFWKRVTFDPGSTDRTGGASEGNDPGHLFNLRSYLNLGQRFELDAFFRYVGALPQPAVEAYAELDARLGYHVRPGLDVAIVGTNLLSPRHLEFRAGTAPQYYERAVTLRSTWRF
jgi:iron complex outermembrane receptor protein